MAHFVQIGDWAFNPDCIQEIRFEAEGKVCIYWHLPEHAEEGPEYTALAGVQAERFHIWWAKADVTV